MTGFDITYHHMSDRAILLRWPDQIQEEILEDIIHYQSVIKSAYKDSVIHFTPAYASLLIRYYRAIHDSKEIEFLRSIYTDRDRTKTTPPKSWDIPVCYNNSSGPDQINFFNKGISKELLIDLHTARTYRIYMIGFLPGFLYLGQLDERLHLPRKPTPSLHVPKGSVAIGGQQTGIYPNDSPGGWHIIGRTSIDIFDLTRDNPSVYSQGDYVRFYAV